MNVIRRSEISFNKSIVVDFAGDKKLYMIINLLSIPLAIFFYLVFYLLFKNFIQDSEQNIFYYFRAYIKMNSLWGILLLVLLFLTTILHELIHGLFYLIFTKEKPVFGFKMMMAYAGSPNWYLKKNCFLIVALSPLVIISTLGCVLIHFIPQHLSSLVFIPVVINGAGCIGDIWISIILLDKPKETYITDNGLVSTICYND